MLDGSATTAGTGRNVSPNPIRPGSLFCCADQFGLKFRWKCCAKVKEPSAAALLTGARGRSSVARELVGLEQVQSELDVRKTKFEATACCRNIS